MTALEDARAVVRELRDAQGDGSMWEEDLFARAADMIEILTAPPTDDEREALARMVCSAVYGEPDDLSRGTKAAEAIFAAGFRRQGPITDALALDVLSRCGLEYRTTDVPRMRAALEAARDAT